MPSMLSLRTRAEAELELRRRRRLAESTTPPLWEPYPDSPQARAVASPADVTGYGGAAGGGKTDWLLGLAGTRHRRSILFRREAVQLAGLVERSTELFAGHGKFNGQSLTWRDLPGGRKIEFGHVQHPGDERKYQGRPHDFIGFDELTHFLPNQFWFLLGWLRDKDGRTRVAATFNPPTNAAERWVIDLFAPWLDRKHPNPAMPGEIRWFARVDGDRVERPDGSPFEHGGETIVPKSWTFFPARLADNPAYAATGYGAQLQSLPEPLRSQLLYGDFDAAARDDPWQIIPTAWIVAAMERWKRSGGMARVLGFSPTVIAQDVAHGGFDMTVNAARYGDWIAPLDKHKGKDTPDGATAAATALRLHSGEAIILVDAIGYGASSFERLRDALGRDKVRAIDFGGASEYRDRSGLFECANVRAEAYWRMRDELDPERPGGATLMLPDDPELLADLAAPRYEIRPSGIKVEDKAEIRKRIGRSPDSGDAAVMTLLPTSGPIANDATMRRGASPFKGYRG